MTATAHDGARPGEPLACLEIPYDLRFTDTVQAWLAGLVGLAGGSRRETASLHLALDETLTFLINAYPDAEPWERMRLAFALPEDGLAEVAVSNAGPPVHLDRIPRYDPQSPAEADLNGLWYFLASEASDELVFENRGMEGWRAVIRKRLAEPAFAPRPPAKTAETGPAHQIVFTTRQAVPEDAAELVDLTYDTYRYSYPVEEFYHEDQLRQALARGEISSFVVEADGRIVGNSTFIISPGTPRCAYSCSLMVRRAFRQSRAIMHLIKAVEQALAEASLDVDLYYGTMVTTHTGSQKAGARVGFHPLCLLLAVGAPVDYRGMRVATSERESFLLCLRLAVPPALSTLYLPERHHVVMAALLGQIGFTGALSADEAVPAAATSALQVREDATEGSATVTVTRLGRDWAERLQRKIFGLKAKGIRTVVILIPAWQPVPPRLDAKLARLNAVLSGLKPVSAREYFLVYCALSGPMDFDRIRLLDPLAEALREHSRHLYDELVADAPE